MPIGEQFRATYPGLKPAEVDVWRAYLREHEGDYDAFEYNVRVGEGLRLPSRAVELAGDEADKFAAMYRALTQRKIDVLAYRPGEAWLIEVEERADTATLGQVLVYEDLLRKGHPEIGRLERLVVCKRLGADLLAAFERQGVLVWRQDAP